MIRSRGLRGYRSLSSSTPQRRVSDRRRTDRKTGRYSGTSVLAGRKHNKTASSLRRKLSGSHTRHDTPYIHSQYNTKGIHKPHNIPSRRKSLASFTYHSTVSTHTPYNIPFTHTHVYLQPKPLDMMRSRGLRGHRGQSLTAPFVEGAIKLRGTVNQYRKAR
jgi:hypothetical protein